MGHAILADTSVWIDHLRRGNEKLASALAEGRVLMHWAILGEIALGSLKNRTEFLELLMDLPLANHSENAETLTLIDAKRLWNKGIGWVDAQLLASALLSNAEILTLDKSLAAAWKTLNF